MSKNKLSQTDKETLANVTKSYTNEELDVVIKEIPDDYLWNEIMRRDSFAIEGINYIEGILDVSFDNLHPIPDKAWSEIKARYEDLQDKYIKIRKVFGE